MIYAHLKRCLTKSASQVVNLKRKLNTARHLNVLGNVGRTASGQGGSGEQKKVTVTTVELDDFHVNRRWRDFTDTPSAYLYVQP